MEDVSNYILNIPTLNEGCTVSLSNPNFQNDTITYKYVADSSSTMPMFLLFQRQNDNHYKFHNDGSQSPSSDTTFCDNETSKFITQKKFSEKTANVQYGLLLTQNSAICDVISSENPRRCSDDNGFYSAAEDSVSETIDTNIAKEDICCSQGRQWKTPQERVVNTELNKVQDSSDSMAIDALEGKDMDSQSTKALLNVSPACSAKPNFKLNCYRPNGTTLSLEEDHLKDVQHWYVVVSRLTMKEKLTRRQLFQIGGMTFLGFIFVGLIIIWVFSPVLF